MDSSNTSSSPGLEIRMFGRFEVYIFGEKLNETEIKGRKARSLLKLLAHQRHFQMVRDQATEILWPDLDMSASNSQLYKALHHIRKAFSKYADDGSDWIEISDDLIRLAPSGGLVTDVQRFEEVAREGLQDQKIPELKNAASIYNGDFLPMDRFAQWASLPREHYRQLYLDVITVLALQYEKRGELSEAAEMLRKALDKEPTLEAAHQGLMRIFARRGQATRAFHQYEVCRNLLRDELGVNPSSEIKKTLNDIREGTLLKEEKKGSVTPVFSGPEQPVIGRKEECEKIDFLLDNLVKENGGGLIVTGEAGIGKTRLIRELIKRARYKQLPFYLGRTGSGNGPVSYGPFIELFDDILHKHPELGKILPAEISSLVPGFTGNGDRMPHADKMAAKGYLFARIHRFFSELAEIEPVSIILEDLHAADQGTRDLLTYLFRHRGDLPVLFVVSLRKDEDEPASDLEMELQKYSADVLELAPLSYEELVNLIHQNADNAVIGADTTAHIHQLAEGNPLYAIELLRHYADEGYPNPSEYQKGTGMLPSSSVSEKIPASIRYMVDQKLEKLSPPAHHLLYIAAIIGRQVPYELLASIWGSGDGGNQEELFNALEEVIRARLLEEEGLDYTFRHALVQETIYASVSEARRRILHKQIADRLLEMSSETEKEPVEKIARHYIGANELIKGAQYLQRSGEIAENSYAHDDALQHYRQAYEILAKVENEEAGGLKCELLERSGDVYRACGKLEKSYSAYEEAITLADEIDLDNFELMELYRKVAVVAILRTEMDRSDKYLTQAFELAGNDPRARARLNITKALHLWHLNQLEEAYDLAKKALTQAKKADSDAEASQACEILAMTCLPLGRWEEGLKYEMERQLHGWSPEIVVATDAHLCLWEYHVSGDQPFQKAQSFLEQVSEQASHVGDFRCVAVCHYALGTMHLWRGNRRHAVDELSSSLKLHEQVGSPAGMAYSLARKSVLHTLMGANELGWQAIRDGLEYAGQAAVRDHCLQRLYGVGIWNRIEADDQSAAFEMVKKSEVLLSQSGACAACALELYPWLAYYYLANNQIEKARESGKAVSELAEKTGNPIGEAISAMIQSSLCVAEKDQEQAEVCREKSYQILNKAVPETSNSPVAHYLERMISQQDELNTVVN